jgi:hypothetical protein
MCVLVVQRTWCAPRKGVHFGWTWPSSKYLKSMRNLKWNMLVNSRDINLYYEIDFSLLGCFV